MTRKTLLPALFLQLACLPTVAQVSNRDLEGLERHRSPQRTISVLQSIDDPVDSSSTTASLIGTWDFLDEEDRAGEYKNQRGAALNVDYRTMKARLAGLPQELILPYNKLMEAQIASYVVSHAGALRGIIGKYQYYEGSIRAAFRRHGLPEDLTALAIVESAMNPLALSKAGARGMWQFMPETARRYGLRCDYQLDERLDPFRSADAAARYLKAAYNRFGNWPLAISSYNCGPGAVESAIKKAGKADFWSIYPYLPAETRGYMPAFVAALYSLKYHSLHGIVPRKYSQGQIKNFQITRELSFSQIVRATGIPRKDLEALNPQYLNGRIPGDRRHYVLRLPKKYEKLFKDNINVVDAD